MKVLLAIALGIAGCGSDPSGGRQYHHGDGGLQFENDDLLSPADASGSLTSGTTSGGTTAGGTTAGGTTAGGTTAGGTTAGGTTAGGTTAGGTTAGGTTAGGTTAGTTAGTTSGGTTGGTNLVTGGPCASGVSGATAIRVSWSDAGGSAQVNYDAFGLPDHSRDHVEVYPSGGSIDPNYHPEFDDQYLGDGGLVLDGSDFIDIEISTVGLSTIGSATLSIYGRSFNTTTSGGFEWTSSAGGVVMGGTADDLVWNSAPYQWYSAAPMDDFLSAIDAGDGGLLVRVKAGGLSGSLIVNQLEICLDAS